MTTANTIHLCNDELELIVDLQGARIKRLATKDGLPILQDCANKSAYTPDECGGFVLLPMGNRVAHNCYELPETVAVATGAETETEAAVDAAATATVRTVMLTKTAPDGSEYLHGTGWTSLWTVESCAQDSAVLTFANHHEEAGAGYNFAAKLQLSLQGRALYVELQVQHLAAEPRLYGVGFHPYFAFDTAADELLLSTTAYAPEKEHHLSDTYRENMGNWDFGHWRKVPDVFVNHAYQGFQGAKLKRAQHGATVELSSSCDYLMMYRPQGSGFIALEPQSHAVDAAHSVGRAGLKLLTQEFPELRSWWQIKLH